MKLRTGKCQRCGREWTEPAKPGGVRRFCLETCSDPKNASRDLRTLEANDPERAAAVSKKRDLPSSVESAGIPLRVAFILSTKKVDDRLALSIAGVDPDSPDADHILERARTLYPEIVAGNPSAIANIRAAAVHQPMLTVLFKAHEMSASQAAAAMKAVSQSEETGIGKLHTRIILNIKGFERPTDQPPVDPVPEAN